MLLLNEEAQETGVLRIDGDPWGQRTCRAGCWAEQRAQRLPFYPEISAPGRPQPCPSPKKAQMRKTQRARMAALGREGGSAAFVVIWAESEEGGQDGCQW